MRASDALYYYDGNRRIDFAPTGQYTSQGSRWFAPLGESTPFVLTSSFLLQLDGRAYVDALTSSWGVNSIQAADYAPGFFLVEVGDPWRALQLANSAVESGQALAATPQLARELSTRDLPNDPLFADQANLYNTGQNGGTTGADIHVASWWDFGGNARLGAGVNVAIVDTGFEYTHPDLAANYRPVLSYDFNQNDADPAPNPAFDFHGTAVAGIVAANGNNGVGVTGAAPRAGISSIRLLSGLVTDAQQAAALTFQNNNQNGAGTNDIYNNSWGPDNSGTALGAPGPLTVAALASGVTSGREGKGSIFVWAAGNGNANRDNSNYDGFANSRYVIAVGATRNDADGSQSFYSEPGANLLVNAPSSGGTLAVTTTDLSGASGYSAGDYTNAFTGTSSATPAVSGTIALMLEANPNLTWRDVKHVLVHTAMQNDASHADWTTNAAGHAINHAYGFGRVDAYAAASLAATWANVGPEISVSAASNLDLGLNIPDGLGPIHAANLMADPVFGPALSSTLELDAAIKLETVEVSVDVSHLFRGDLEFSLIAPSGTVSLLGNVRPDNGGNLNWTFSSVRNWDELGAGTWTLSIRDGYRLFAGRLNSWSLTAYGTLVPEPAGIVLMLVGGCGLAVQIRRKGRRATSTD